MAVEETIKPEGEIPPIESIAAPAPAPAAPAAQPGGEPSEPKRAGRPRKESTTPEPQMVLPGTDPAPAAPRSTAKAKTASSRAGTDVNITDITNGLITALGILSSVGGQFAPGGSDLWTLTPDEAKKIATPAAKIIHRHGGGKALHPDVVDGLMLAQALGMAVLVRYAALQDHARAQGAAAALQQQTSAYVPQPAPISDTVVPSSDPEAIMNLKDVVQMGRNRGIGVETLEDRVRELEGR